MFEEKLEKINTLGGFLQDTGDEDYEAVDFDTEAIRDFLITALSRMSSATMSAVEKIVEGAKPRPAGSMHQSYNDGKMDMADNILALIKSKGREWDGTEVK